MRGFVCVIFTEHDHHNEKHKMTVTTQVQCGQYSQDAWDIAVRLGVMEGLEFRLLPPFLRSFR